MVAGGEKSALCAFADWFPTLVAGELEQARALRHQSRETSWTDRMLLELKKLRDPRIFVQDSNERVSGADMDWHFVSHDGQRHIQLAVQAKILHYTKVRTPYRYDELAYPKRSGRQSRQLTNYARRQIKNRGISTYPLYLFYNPSSVEEWPCFCSPGITLASAYRMAHHLNASRKFSIDNKVSLQAIEFETIEPLMFCLPSIFCSDFANIPDPDDVANALALIDAEKRAITIDGPRPPLPKAGSRIPEEIGHIVGLMQERMADRLFADGDDLKSPERPRVIFMSGEDRR